MAMIGAFFLYTGILVFLGCRRSVAQEAYHDAGRQLGSWTVFLMVVALWSSSLIVVQIDTAYASGISAIWFGVSVATMSVMVSLLIPWFRQRGYTSNSALLGKTFGPRVQRLSGLVIGATFPIFALSNALAAGVFLHVAFHWPLWVSLAVTTAALILYIQFAGLVSLARTQGLNLAMVCSGLMLAAWKLAHVSIVHPASVPPAYWHWFGIGHGLVWVWFGMNMLNVFSAQAEIQTVAAARDGRRAQWAVWLSTIVLLGVIGVSTWLGIVTRLVMGGKGMEGLVAYAALLLQHSSPAFTITVGLSMWALALTWCGPLLFSGAVSLDGDVFRGRSVKRWTQVALVVEGLLMIGYALWRPAEVAWWRVFGLTLRNAAIVVPTVALFLWEDINESAVLSSMVGGVVVGIGLNALTGFSPTHFVGGINPMWAAATASFVILAMARLWAFRRYGAIAAGLGGGALLFVGLQRSGVVPQNILGLALLAVAGLLVGLAWSLTRRGGIGVQTLGENALG
ncbi:MAG: sodium:solute symporter [Thermaerobacter sp.]|nr:sodium:solute symporter [Thermaerobacter sp.]